MTEEDKLSAEIGKHLMQPENYGILEDADCIGVGVDKATKTYVAMYIKIDEKTISNVMFCTNGNQDTTTLGSLFTEMIKGDEITNALSSALVLEEDLKKAYESIEVPKIDTSKEEDEKLERVSTEHQDSANMVLTSFRAAMRHYDRQKEGIKEEHFEINIAKTCPHSGSNCNHKDK